MSFANLAKEGHVRYNGYTRLRVLIFQVIQFYTDRHLILVSEYYNDGGLEIKAYFILRPFCLKSEWCGYGETGNSGGMAG